MKPTNVRLSLDSGATYQEVHFYCKLFRHILRWKRVDTDAK